MYKFNEKRIFLFVLLFRVALDCTYIAYVSKNFSYAGFYLSLNFMKYILSYCYLIILALYTPSNIEKVTSFFAHVQLSIIIIPMLSYYALNNQSTYYMTLICCVYILQMLILKKYKTNSKIKLIGMSKALIISMYGFVILTLVFSLVLVGKPTFSAFNFDNIYTLREDRPIVSFLGYTVTWCTKVIIPYLIIFNYSKKKYSMFFLFVTIQILFFMIFAHKSMLFSLAVIFGIYFLYEKKWLLDGYYLGLTGSIALSMYIYIHTGNFFSFLSFFVRRWFYVPAQIKFDFFDFFSIREKVYFADGLIGKIFGIKSHYDFEIKTLIATYRKGTYSTGANTGYFGDAYANLGTIGVIIIGILVIMTIILLEKWSCNLPTSVVAASSGYIFMAFNDQAFFTLLLTGGLFMFLFMIYIFNSDVSPKDSKIDLNSLKIK